MTDQPNFGLVTGLAAQSALRLSCLILADDGRAVRDPGRRLSPAGGSVSPASVAHSYKDAYVSE